jgi:hypothetical protein
VSIGHESPIDTEALTDALESGIISSAYINVFGFPRTGPFRSCENLAQRALENNIPRLFVRRASTDARVAHAAWDFVCAVAKPTLKLNSFDKLGRVFFCE